LYLLKEAMTTNTIRKTIKIALTTAVLAVSLLSAGITPVKAAEYSNNNTCIKIEGSELGMNKTYSLPKNNPTVTVTLNNWKTKEGNEETGFVYAVYGGSVTFYVKNNVQQPEFTVTNSSGNYMVPGATDKERRAVSNIKMCVVKLPELTRVPVVTATQKPQSTPTPTNTAIPTPTVTNTPTPEVPVSLPTTSNDLGIYMGSLIVVSAACVAAYIARKKLLKK
jgi:hypothetical protein